ncbi:MAG TPA: hypothetical protein VGO00_23710, partial [Kofleriaceae bacterium]|nr:hypothetical protein [Kofleriaceae bacterium]
MVRSRLIGAIALLVVIGCRDAKDRPTAPVADAKLAWPAVDDGALTAVVQRTTPVVVGIASDGAVVVRGMGGVITEHDAAGHGRDITLPPALRNGSVELAGDRLLVTLGDRAVAIDRATGSLHELGTLHDPQLSPDGAMVAFVRDGDLWIAP